VPDRILHLSHTVHVIQVRSRVKKENTFAGTDSGRIFKYLNIIGQMAPPVLPGRMAGPDKVK
jgi:hypothetical protein